MHSIFRWTIALLLVLGEFHGTRETPVLVRELMEAYAVDGTPVALALELPTGENAALATYLASSGAAKARAALRGTPYWSVHSRMHDGRRSKDMLDLIEAARVLRTRGCDVQVFGFDRVLPAETAGNGARDRAMAEEVRVRAKALPNNARLLVLIGNVHGMRTQPKMIAYPPMTALLKDLELYNVRIEARGGEAWGCVAPGCCEARQLPGHAGTAPRVDSGADRSYDLRVWLPRFSVGRLLDSDSVW